MGNLVEQVVQHVRSRSTGGPIASDIPVTLNFHPDVVLCGQTTIERLASEGVYRSQFETGTSNGGLTAYIGGSRWLWERHLFGTTYDEADWALRPKYGALNYRADPAGGSRRFGSCHLRLKPHMMGRTTFCYPDSHMQPENFGVADRMALIALADRNEQGLDPLDDYIEAHVHGLLLIAEDVEVVVLDPSYRGTPVEESAQSLPCKVEWHDGFRMFADSLADCEAYRGAEVAKTLSRLLVDNAVTPLDIGTARVGGLDPQLAKWAWHCVARFGHSANEH